MRFHLPAMSDYKVDEKEKLLNESFIRKYGSLNLSTDDKKSITTTKKYGLFGLFRYASNMDILLMLGGSIAAIVVGSTGPLLGTVFGSMTNILSQASVYGITNNATDFGESALNQFTNLKATSSLATGPIPQDEFLSQMTQFSLYYLYIGISALISAALQAYLWEVACERQVFKLRKAYFSQVLRQDIEWFDSHGHGDLSSKLSDDLERVREGIGHKLAVIIQYMATLVAGLVVGLVANWKLTLVLAAVGPLVVGSSAYMASTVSGGAAREQLRYSLAGKVAEEVFTCLRTVTAFGGEHVEVMRYESALNEGKKVAMKKYYSVSAGMCFVSFISYATYGFAFWYSAQLIQSGEATVGSIFTVFFAVMAGSLGIGPVLPYLNSVSIAIGSAEVIFNIIDRSPPIDPYSTDGMKLDLLSGRIEFKDVFFTYPTRKGYPILNGLSFSVKPGQTVAIIGPSGAGKSTLVNLILRFYDINRGAIYVDGHNINTLNLKSLRNNIGIVSQEPVLFGVSIADNIRYGKEDVTNEELLKAATIANAHHFIKDLPKGYNTLVGERGTQLSGGQKQRIAIARALVRDPKILLLDEATSALDAQSEEAVQAALDTAKQGRTTLIIAHRLSTIRDSDLIYSMKDGKVVESGSHDQLMEMKGLYFDLVNMQKKEEKTHIDSSVKNIDNNMGKKFDEVTLDQARKSIHEVEKDEPNPTGVVWRMIKLNLPEWHLLLFGFLSACCQGVVTPVFAFFYAQVFATFQLDNDEMEEETPFWSSMFVGLGVVSGATMAVNILAMSAAAEHLLARVRLFCFQNVISQQISWFDQEEYSSGRLLTMLAKEAPIVKSCSGLRAGQILSTVCTIIAAVGIAVAYGVKLACVLLMAVPVLVYASYKQMSRLRHSLIINNKGMNDSGKVAAEGVQNVKTVQSLGSEKLFVEKYIQHLDAPYRDNLRQAFWFAFTCALAYAIPYIVYAAAFRLGSYLIINEEMTPTNVYRVFFSLSLSAAAIGVTSAFFQDMSKGKIAAEQIFRLIDKRSTANPTLNEGIEHETKGNISFEDIHFSYPTRPDAQILRGLSLTVKAGQTVALVGESGCGKSTLISLLERFYSPEHGTIKLDGIDIDKIKLSNLRQQIGIVTQEPVLFSGSVKYNIAYGALESDVSDADIIAAAKLANIHTFISSLPLGYDTPCGDRGTQMSGGQKQRIAIARALIRDPKILLLDEATSALDVESEKVVQQALDRARMGRTSLVVSHRLSTVQNADQIAVIQNGEVVELGTHEELMVSGGFYCQLVNTQQM